MKEKQAVIRAGLLLAILTLSALASVPARASDNRLYLADQSDFGAKQGFYLDLENSAPGDQSSRLSTLRLILGYADGNDWRFLTVTPAWRLNHAYTARGLVSQDGAQLWLDGAPVGKSSGDFTPQGGILNAGAVPGWANGPAGYLIIPDSLTLVNGAEHLSASFESQSSRPLPLMLFEPGSPRRFNWVTHAEAPLTITATFHLVARPDPHTYAPFIDRYGQNRYAHWPEKIQTDADLKASLAQEDQRLAQWGAPPGYDRYGGDLQLGWKDHGTGFYRVVKHDSFYWLVTPEGNPCFYRAVCSAPQLTWEMTPVTGREYLFSWLPPHDAAWSAAWGQDAWGDNNGTHYFSVRAANLIRKYGAAWRDRATAATRRRLKVWGFSGDGKWDSIADLPSLPVLSRAGVPNVARHPDIFDPAIRQQLEETLRKQIEPRKNDPYVVGWSIGNEYDEIITAAETRDILAKPATVPAKRALVDYALDHLYNGDLGKLSRAWGTTATTRNDLYAANGQVPAGDLEQLRRYYADQYYGTLYDLVKGIDPNHLYLGFWIAIGWWENSYDWNLDAAHCDVVGYDRYADDFADGSFSDLMKATNKPVLCGEYSFPAWYDGWRGFGLYGTYAQNDLDSGRKYARWMHQAASSPYCVGVSWFEYRDEPLTGRGPGRGPDLVYGEHYAFGLVTEQDQPKWGLVDQVRLANLQADHTRLHAENPPARRH